MKYIKESFQELSKVSWPTLEQTVKYTAYVLIFSAITAALIGAIDLVFNTSYKQVVDFTIEQGINAQVESAPVIQGGGTQPIQINSDGAAQPIDVKVEGGSGNATVTPAQ